MPKTWMPVRADIDDFIRRGVELSEGEALVLLQSLAFRGEEFNALTFARRCIWTRGKARWFYAKHKDSVVGLGETTKTTKKPTVKKQTMNFGNDFEAIWDRYPNKDGKKAAKRHFDATVKTEADIARINRALDNYLASENVKRGYIKNGSTWFNNWADWEHRSPAPVGNSEVVL